MDDNLSLSCQVQHYGNFLVWNKGCAPHVLKSWLVKKYDGSWFCIAFLGLVGRQVYSYKISGATGKTKAMNGPSSSTNFFGSLDTSPSTCHRNDFEEFSTESKHKEPNFWVSHVANLTSKQHKYLNFTNNSNNRIQTSVGWRKPTQKAIVYKM